VPSPLLFILPSFTLALLLPIYCSKIKKKSIPDSTAASFHYYCHITIIVEGWAGERRQKLR
jgi:hypothetical protein